MQLGICHFSRLGAVESGYHEAGKTWSELRSSTTFKQWTHFPGPSFVAFAIGLAPIYDVCVVTALRRMIVLCSRRSESGRRLMLFGSVYCHALQAFSAPAMPMDLLSSLRVPYIRPSALLSQNPCTA